MELVGQIFGWLAALFTVISYQCKTQKQLLAVQSVATFSVAMGYFFVGAYPGMVLNVMCLLRNMVYSFGDRKPFSHPATPWILTLVMGAAGILSWDGPISLLIIIAIMINTLFLSDKNVQNLRRSILLTSTMIIIYNVFCHLWGGVLNEFLAIASSAVGLYRYRNQTYEKS